jgi:hypothetical protein
MWVVVEGGCRTRFTGEMREAARGQANATAEEPLPDP